MIVDGLLPMGHDALFTLSWRMTGDFFSHGLPALSFVAGRFDSVAQRPMCRLADLFNPFEDVFALCFVNRHPEGLPAVRGLDDRNCQIAADVCLRFRFLRHLQDLEKLLGVGGRLEARKKQVYVGFIREGHFVRLALQSGFEGMESKRPEFPSGITSGARPTIQSWFIQRVWERRVARGDGDR
jgi:hypothetical protein